MRYKEQIGILFIKRIVIFSLVYLVSLILYFTPNVFSKFKSNSTKNTKLNIARWYVKSELDTKSIDIITGTNIYIGKLIVENNSDTSCKYSISITQIPNGLEVALDGGEFIEVINNKIEFLNIGELETGNKVQNEHILQFKAPLNQEEFNGTIGIDVIFTQEKV